MQKYLALTAIAFATSLASAPAGAWGREGHEIVAAVAEAHLDPTARAAVAQLLPSSRVPRWNRSRPGPTKCAIAPRHAGTS